MNSPNKRFAAFAFGVVLSALLAVGCSQRETGGGNAGGSAGNAAVAAAPSQLVICYLPSEAGEELAEHRGLLQDAMSRAVGVRVVEVNIADYNAAVEAMRTGRADIVYFGAVSYVQAAERSGAQAMAIVAPFGDKNQSGYTSKIITRADSDIRTLEDLRGRTFAFVDPASTSGGYVPTMELMNAFPGTTSEDFKTNGRFFSSVTYSGRHQNGLQAVLMGDIDAVPIDSDILNAEIMAGRVSESDFRLVHESPRIPPYPMSIRSGVPEDIKDKVKEFFLSYTDPAYFQYIMGVAPEKSPRFVEAFDSDYDYIRDLMQKVMPR